MFTEYCDSTLHEVIAFRRFHDWKWTDDQVSSIFADLTVGLSQLQALNIAHRDLRYISLFIQYIDPTIYGTPCKIRDTKYQASRMPNSSKSLPYRDCQHNWVCRPLASRIASWMVRTCSIPLEVFLIFCPRRYTTTMTINYRSAYTSTVNNKWENTTPSCRMCLLWVCASPCVNSWPIILSRPTYEATSRAARPTDIVAVRVIWRTKTTMMCSP